MYIRIYHFFALYYITKHVYKPSSDDYMCVTKRFSKYLDSYKKDYNSWKEFDRKEMITSMSNMFWDLEIMFYSHEYQSDEEKQEWFEKLISGNELLIGENKCIFLNISMKMKNVKKKKEFSDAIDKIGNNKVLTMLQLMAENELELWLPSMTCVQLKVICQVLSIKQSGKKKEITTRIINYIHQDK